MKIRKARETSVGTKKRTVSNFIAQFQWHGFLYKPTCHNVIRGSIS